MRIHVEFNILMRREDADKEQRREFKRVKRRVRELMKSGEIALLIFDAVAEDVQRSERPIGFRK